VITDLMQFARPAAPRFAVTPVARLVAEAAQTLRALADERRVRIVCPEAPANLAVRADAGQIRLALVNLLRNAIEAAPADGWASLRIQRSDRDIVFAVEDNGPGIPETHRSHLFDPFYSGRSAGRGRGMGLATAWRLARLHGGDVVLDKADEGARFHLILPGSDVIDNYVPPVNGKRDPIGYQYSAIG
jgi:signal transduction histidine kinase